MSLNNNNSKRSRPSAEAGSKADTRLCPHNDLSLDMKRFTWNGFMQIGLGKKDDDFKAGDMEVVPNKLIIRNEEMFCVECDDYVMHPEVDAVKVHAQNEQRRQGRIVGRVSLPVGGLGICGMVNLGNTCFMGSILQVILQLDTMRDYFLSGKHRSTCVPAAKAAALELSSSSDKQPVETNGSRYRDLWLRPWSESKEIAMNFSTSSGDVPACFGCELESLFAEVSCPSNQVGQPVIAHRILQNLWTFSPALAGYYQQDAQELYNALVNAVHAHVCSTMTLASSLPRSPSPVMTNNNSSIHSEPSSPSGASQRDGTLACQCIVHRELGGVLRSQLTCAVCGNSSSRFEPFFELPLDLNHGQTHKNGNNKEETEGDLRSRLDAFVRPEIIQGVQCTSCENAPQDASKTLSLHVLPPTLALHLKRFQASMTLLSAGTSSRSGSASMAASGLQKNTSPVAFPIRTLDLKQYVSARCQCEITLGGTKSECECFVYDLRAVVQHTGQLAGGHYIAFVRQESSGIWFKLDDEEVSRVNEETVTSAEAYMLFYSKRSPKIQAEQPTEL